MIRLLQRKFIIVAMGSLLAVLILVLGGMNLLHHYQLEQQAEGLLWMIASYAGELPEEQNAKKFLHPAYQKEATENKYTSKDTDDHDDNAPISLEDSRYDTYRELQFLRQLLNADPHISVETRFSTRYFTVLTDKAGTITQMNLNHIAINKEIGQQYAETVLSSQAREGYLEHYKYLLLDNDTGSIIVFLDCTNQLETARSFFYLSCGIALFVFVVVFLLVLFFSRSAIAPIITSIEKQKQFITDAGHELKTPLAIIAANNDVLTLYHGENQWTESINKQITRLNGLVQELLLLARMEEQQQAHDLLDFSALVEETALPFAVLIQQKQATFDWQIEPALLVRGEPRSLQKMISVLVDNAAKYVQPSGRIMIILKKKNRNIQLEVYNSCNILPDSDLNLLFDRFRRTDLSRARESGGYGIGLSVARAVAENHHGKICVRRQDHGICFYVRIPLSL